MGVLCLHSLRPKFLVDTYFLTDIPIVMPLLAICQELSVCFETCHFVPIDPLLCASVCPLCHLCDVGASISFVSCGTHDVASS